MRRDHLLALGEAYLVTFLWSPSYILVKIGLIQLSPLTLAALRYLVASMMLVPLAFMKEETHLLKGMNLFKVLFFGLSAYAIGQGLRYLGLFYLPAVSVSFILNFTPVIVLVLEAIFLRERPTFIQLVGMALAPLGAYSFFNTSLSVDNLTGILLTLLSGLGWAAYLVLSRFLFVKNKMSTLELTGFSMDFGTLLIAASAYLTARPTIVSLSSWGIIIWLGVVNTAFTFLL